LGIAALGLFAGGEAAAFAVHLKDVDMVGEPVEQCTGQAFRAENGGPFIEGQIAGDQPNRRMPLLLVNAPVIRQNTIQSLLEASLRMRPDRIFLGELRGAEAWSFLRAVNTGHPGSLTTVHADSPDMAYEQLMLMALQANLGLKREEIITYIRTVLPICVQLTREGGWRGVAEIQFSKFRQGSTTEDMP
jgi:Type II/IV secretion system protein